MQPLLVAGSPGSPYTRKLVAALRFKRVPYRLVLVNPDRPRLPQPKVRLLPTVYFDDGQGGVEPAVDTTPILRRLEREWPGRPVTPADPVVAFIDALVEDFADEWLTKAMFHYRWARGEDIRKAARVLPNWFDAPLDDATLATAGDSFTARQIDRLSYVGSNDVTAATIERSFERLTGWLVKTPLVHQSPSLATASMKSSVARTELLAFWKKMEPYASPSREES